MVVLGNLETPHHPELYARGSYSLLDTSPSQLANNADTFILQACMCPLMTRRQSSHHQIQESAGAMREERDKSLLSLVTFY